MLTMLSSWRIQTLQLCACEGHKCPPLPVWVPKPGRSSLYSLHGTVLPVTEGAGANNICSRAQHVQEMTRTFPRAASYSYHVLLSCEKKLLQESEYQIILLISILGLAVGFAVRLTRIFLCGSGVLFRIFALACHLTEVFIIHTQVPFVPEDVMCTAFVVELTHIGMVRCTFLTTSAKCLFAGRHQGCNSGKRLGQLFASCTLHPIQHTVP